ncbi:MAG: hypothetical protein JWR05_3006 [Mucilaginibacter sp.]|nr:hypothetical protein [Mucilaginibacter sp.]
MQRYLKVYHIVINKCPDEQGRSVGAATNQD